MTVTEKVFNSHDNVAILLVKQDEVAVDFSGAIRFTLTLGGITIDTDDDSTAITATSTLGELQFDIGGKSIPIGSHNATLIWFDGSHTNGQVLASADDADLIFQVKSCN